MIKRTSVYSKEIRVRDLKVNGVVSPYAVICYKDVPKPNSAELISELYLLKSLSNLLKDSQVHVDPETGHITKINWVPKGANGHVCDIPMFDLFNQDGTDNVNGSAVFGGMFEFKFAGDPYTACINVSNTTSFEINKF